MRFRRALSGNRSTTATYASPGRLAGTLERQIEDILSQVAPRRQSDAGSRGVVTVLFVTIADFTELCEMHEPPEVGSVLEVYLETVVDSIRKFLGTVHNALGGTVMATWNAVAAQPDHAALAVNSAIDMVERIEDVNERLRAMGLPQVGYTMGITTGDAVVRHLPAVRLEDEVIGDCVNVAHLLSQAGSNCSILIGEGTRVSVGEQILVEEAATTTLPGKRKPVKIFRVLGRVTPL